MAWEPWLNGQREPQDEQAFLLNVNAPPVPASPKDPADEDHERPRDWVMDFISTPTR